MAESSCLTAPFSGTPVPTDSSEARSSGRTGGEIDTIGFAGGAFIGYGGVFTGTCAEGVG